MMGHLLTGIEPVEVWEHFYALSQIPRPSRGEGAICRYICGLAQRYGLEPVMDTAEGDFGNIVVRVPATTGYEKAPAVIVQSHVDMVSLPAERRGLPLELIRDGTWLRARGSTLGADNGIGVAMALCLITEPGILHGPLELLFTIDEEAGMTGVLNLSDRVLQGRMLINIDSLEAGALTVSCAGSNLSILRLPLEMGPAPRGLIPARIQITGGRGGHSGLDIHRGRANAGILLTRLLYGETGRSDPVLWDIEWGQADNAIPSEAKAVVLVRPDGLQGLREAVRRWEKVFVEECGQREGHLQVSLDEGVEWRGPVMDASTARRVLSLLLALPHGVQQMSSDVEGLVQTSSNVAIVRTSETELTVHVSQRSSVDSALDAIVSKCEAVAGLAGAELANPGRSHGWKADVNSRLTAVCREAYREVFGEEPRITGIHGLLECGLIKAKYPEMDVIALSPLIRDAHTPTKAGFVPGVDSDTTGERVDVASMPRFWDFVKTVLKKTACLET